MTKRPLAAIPLAALALSACGNPPAVRPSPNAGAALQVAVLNAATDQCAPCVVMGADRRVSMAILDRDGVPVPGATVSVQVARVPSGSASAVPLGPPVDAAFKGALLQDKGVYVIHQGFDAPGIYKVVAHASKAAISATTEANFQVIPTDPGIAVGAPAPLTHEPLSSQVTDISTIDTGVPPDDMHYTTTADAVAAHHGLVLFFGSPGFCQTKTCAPEVDVVKSIEAKYRSRGVDFVHVETYQGGRPDANKTVNPVFDQWKLTTDPWVFVVDRSGKVSAKFDGPATADEIEPFVAAAAG